MIRSAAIPSATSDSRLAELVERLTDQIAAGDASAVEAILLEHPADAERLRKLLPTLEVLAGLTASVGLGNSAPADAGPPSKLQSEICNLQLLGDFHLIREIGRGGMGIVYEAEQRSLRRRVALKVLPFASILDDRLLKRFHHEVHAAAGLTHPHIVPVYAAGSDCGVHYYAMQLIDGQPLDKVIGTLRASSNLQSEIGAPAPTGDLKSPHHVAELGLQAAEALHSAHQLGIIHRDIKPANLLLDNRGKLWITDFGLARIDGEANLTLTGDFLGTLRYMSPEQVRGDRLGTDHRTDIYSLAATLYELLTLQPVVAGHDRAHLLRQITSEDPRPPRKLNRRIPTDLETILLTALAKSPADRYASAHDFAADLRRFLNHQPIRARRLTLWKHAKSLTRRHTAAVLAGASSFLLIAVISIAAAALIWRAKLDTESALASSNASLSVSRQHLYASDIAAAHQACLNDDRDSARALLSQYVPAGDAPDLRGFEWHYLWNLCHQESREFFGHEGHIYTADFSPDSRTLATGGSDGVIRLWDVDSGQVIRELRGHRTDVNSVVFHHTGQTLLSAGGDGTARIWDCDTGRELHILWGHADEADAALFSPDDKLIATGGHDGKICLWDAGSHELIRSFVAHDNRIHGMTFSADSRRLFTSPGKEPVIAWNVETCAKELELRGGWHGNIRALTTSKDGKTLVAAYNGLNAGALARWDANVDGRFYPTPFLTIDSGFADAEFHPHGHILVSASDRLHIWDLANNHQWRQHGVLRRHRGFLWCARFSTDGRWLVSSSRTGELKLCRTPFDASEVLAIDRLDGPPTSLCLAPDGQALVLCDRAGRVVLDEFQSTGTTTRREVIAPGGSSAIGLKLSPDRQWLAACFPTRAELLSLSSGATAGRTWSDESQPTRRCVFSADARRIARCVGDEIRYEDVATGKIIQRLSCKEPSSCCISPDGRWLAAGSLNGELSLWDLTTFQRFHAQAARNTYVSAIEFSGDGALLASGTWNGVVKLWSVAPLREVRRLYSASAEAAGPMPVFALAFSPEGKTLAVGRREPFVRLWQVATGRELLAFRPLSQQATSALRFTPGGQLLVAVGAANSPSGLQLTTWSLVRR